MILSGRARVAGVVGWPVAHSRSPRLHGYWLEEYRIDGAYVPLLVRPESLPRALRGLADAGFRGLNVTLPHKEAALALCDEVDALARRIGAVNTLVFEGGRILGSNTDAFGFLENLREQAPRWSPGDGPAAVLGAGGAARAVIVALLEAGVPRIMLANRTQARARILAAELQATGLKGRIEVVPWSQQAATLAEAALLVNTTTLGMEGQPPLEIPLTRLPPGAVVADIVYTPLETPLLAAARARGHTVVDGLGMLLHQARPGFEAWFGVAPQVTPALRAFVLDTCDT
ncbi:MAG: shikimate dehydrogenase [Alphaproteobacteria bacterium]|nr:MAG: shikimate dehydrogenase [Alphaproteobacteria bacterium]